MKPKINPARRTMEKHGYTVIEESQEQDDLSLLFIGNTRDSLTGVAHVPYSVIVTWDYLKKISFGSNGLDFSATDEGVEKITDFIDALSIVRDWLIDRMEFEREQ